MPVRFPVGNHAPWLDVETVGIFHHDEGDFTQGLVYDDGIVYESTGLKGRSSLIKRRLDTGEVLARKALPRSWFGEGLALIDRTLFQLTWKEGLCQTYEAQTLKPLKRFRYPGEGWGIAAAGRLLVMSDGSDTLVFREPDTFEVVRTLIVREGNRRIGNLNELEVVGNRIYANVFGSDRIALIDINRGDVEAWLDLSFLVSEEQAPDRGVLNGIAYRPDTGNLLVTGKNWRRLYEIQLPPSDSLDGMGR